MKVKRNLNIEMVRIVSMLLIVFGHVIGGFAPTIANGSSVLHTDVPRLMIFITFHVNLFVLISGYCGIKKLKNVWKIWKLVFSYLLLIALMNLTLSLGSFDYTSLLFAISRNPWWFMHIYALLALLAPTMLEPLSATIKQHDLSVLVCVLLIIDVYFGFFCHIKTVHFGGYNLIHFVTIYMIGAYLRTLKVRNIALKGYMLKANHFLFIFVLGMALKVLYHFGIERLGMNDACDEYNHPFNIALAVVAFLWFLNLDITSTKIQFVSNSVIGVYLLQEHPLIKTWLIKEFNTLVGLCNGRLALELLLVPLFVVAIFVPAILIDKVRTSLVNWVEESIVWSWHTRQIHKDA